MADVAAAHQPATIDMHVWVQTSLKHLPSSNAPWDWYIFPTFTTNLWVNRKG